MAERFRGLPFAFIVNPFRLETFESNLNESIEVRRADFLARKKLKGLGYGENAKKVGWRMLINQNDPKIIERRYQLECSVDHTIVLLLPTRALLDIKIGLTGLRRLRGNISIGIKEPWV